MAIDPVTATAECPECFAAVDLNEVLQNEIVQCADCGLDLEITSLAPVRLEPAPEEEEDWGE